MPIGLGSFAELMPIGMGSFSESLCHLARFLVSLAYACWHGSLQSEAVCPGLRF